MVDIEVEATLGFSLMLLVGRTAQTKNKHRSTPSGKSALKQLPDIGTDHSRPVCACIELRK